MLTDIRLFRKRSRNRVDHSAEDRVDDYAAGKVNTDPAAYNQAPAHDGLAHGGVHLAKIEADDAPQDNVENDNKKEEELVGLQVSGGHDGEEAGPGHPGPPLDIRMGSHTEFDHEELGENAQRGAKHEESREKQKDVAAGDVMILQFHDGNCVLYNASADKPRKQDGQALQLYPAKKYRAKTKASNCECSQTGRAGGCEGMLLRHNESSFSDVN